MEPEEPISRPSPEIVTPDLYLTEESIAIRGLVDSMDERVFRKFNIETETI